ncbi:murein hydrolase activator EnvC family protein [Microbacterium sp.]|uniref:murein hydrolase activator EnvC family protein n=1 Tax=Microbacterium sp. TaxID=51671 RepID=UPI003C71D7BE
MPSRLRLVLAFILAALIALTLAAPATGVPRTGVTHGPASFVLGEVRRPAAALDGWQWPVRPPVVVEPYRAPAHPYGPGHRGIDLKAAVGSPVTTPADGVVAFAGTVVDRPLVTIDHGEGLVTTLEPVTPSLPIGAVVTAGDVVGTVAVGGHAAPGSVHFGVREDGEYLNPMLLLGGVPRAVLLPCC